MNSSGSASATKEKGSHSCASAAKKAPIKPCSICSDIKGLCGEGPRDTKFFGIKLRPGFHQRTVIPCFARKQFLQKYSIPCWKLHFYASMTTSHGFQFSFQVILEENLSYITGNAWNEFAKVFSPEAGDEIILKLDTGSPTTHLIPGNYPNNHPAYYRMTDDSRDIIDNLCVTKGTTINWRMMSTIIRYANNIDQMVVQHDAGDYDQGRVYALLHTINNSNRKKNFAKLPSRLIPEDMEKTRDITVVSPPEAMLEKTYSISTDDGRACINGWDMFMAKVPAMVV